MGSLQVIISCRLTRSIYFPGRTIAPLQLYPGVNHLFARRIHSTKLTDIRQPLFVHTPANANFRHPLVCCPAGPPHSLQCNTKSTSLLCLSRDGRFLPPVRLEAPVCSFVGRFPNISLLCYRSGLVLWPVWLISIVLTVHRLPEKLPCVYSNVRQENLQTTRYSADDRSLAEKRLVPSSVT
ncbi:uncharacterized protein LOC110674248 [Aedes aegypti]|uniref:Uncharacterized protein n=1 Tax=Aedes aegypti TaxID=7159 RepID=A0A6I8TYW3_AEDAE|nr:uncharacterized protein LOC110674248 [Aedes aegypti]